MSENFDVYSEYYDLLYEDKQSDREVDYVVDTLKTSGIIGNHWLEIGAGSGRHAPLFLEKGINWTGIDLSEKMSNAGRRKGLNIKVGDMRDKLPFSEQFDVVIGLFHVISYLSTNNDVINSFKNVNKQLKKGGSFLFDVWYSDAVLTQKPERREKEVSNDRITVNRIATPTLFSSKNTVNVNYKISVVDKITNNCQEFTENHLMRHFSIPEISLFASVTGFEVVVFEEWLTKQIPSENTWGVTFILKKVKGI